MFTGFADLERRFSCEVNPDQSERRVKSVVALLMRGYGFGERNDLSEAKATHE